jgi:hypothetical protein
MELTRGQVPVPVVHLQRFLCLKALKLKEEFSRGLPMECHAFFLLSTKIDPSLDFNFLPSKDLYLLRFLLDLSTQQQPRRAATAAPTTIETFCPTTPRHEVWEFPA